jgi:predicted amidophosphoribosyltransferase
MVNKNMVSKCIKCGKILKNFGMYCEKCEKEINYKIDRRDNFQERYNKADFFQRQRMK